jgi:hypothetical protein
MVTFSATEDYNQSIRMRDKAVKRAREKVRATRAADKASAREQKEVLKIAQREADATTRHAYGKGEKAKNYIDDYTKDPTELARRYETLTQKIKSGDPVTPAGYDDLKGIKDRTHPGIRWGHQYENFDKLNLVSKTVSAKASHLGISDTRLPEFRYSWEGWKAKYRGQFVSQNENEVVDKYLKINDTINKYREALNPSAKLSVNERFAALKGVEQLRVPLDEMPQPRIVKMHRME